MVKEEGFDVQKFLKNSSPNQIEADMKIVLGYLNQQELISGLNIGNIMQIQPLSMEDLLI